MEPNTAYNVVHANNRRERETQATALQENTAYNINQKNPTQTDEDMEYSTIENINTAYIEYNTAGDTKSTESVLDNKSNTKHKNESGKKRFAILVIVAFILSLLVAVAAFVYTNIELKNQMISTNNQLQSMNEQLNNQSSQQSNSIVALSSNISEQNKHILRNLNDVRSILEELEQLYLGTINNSASSCSDISQDRPSGEYWISPDASSRLRVYCDMNRTSCSCNTTRGWMRVANLDMTDPNQNCPEGWRLVTRTEPPFNTCGTHGSGCVSTTYSTYGVEYSKVCGRIIAYQSRTPDGFTPYYQNRFLSIDDGYVDGASLTHGQSPRQHIWTFTNAIHEDSSFSEAACPCTRPDLPYTGVLPPFIGQDYFCETGSRQVYSFFAFYSDDPLWDGQGCGGTSTCCEFNNPPWFCKQLPQPTTDDIELRLCGDEDINNEDTPIELVEIYVG